MDKIFSNTWDFFSPEGISAIGKLYREGQEDMAIAVASALVENKHLCIEAGVGIGKSYAYLIPSLLKLKEERTNYPLIISTSSIYLSEQLVGDIEDACRYLLIRNPTIILAKGQGQYVCKQRLRKFYYSKEFLKIMKSEGCSGLVSFLESEKIYDRSGKFEELPDFIWNKINVDRCNHRKCALVKQCFFRRMRENLKPRFSYRDKNRYGDQKKIIVTNHDLLIANLNNLESGSTRIFDKNVCAYIIDEAHHLEEKARTSLTKSIGYNDCMGIVEYIENLNSIHYDQIKLSESYKTKEKINLIFKKISDDVKRQIKIKNRLIENGRFALSLDFYPDLKELLFYLENIKYSVDIALSREHTRKFLPLSDKLDDLINMLGFLNSEDYFFWIEVTKPHVNICSAPHNILNALKTFLFDQKKVPVVLTSATLTTCNSDNNIESYKYLCNAVGFPLEEKNLDYPKKSPYNYNKSLLYISRDIESPSGNEAKYICDLSEKIMEIARQTQGRMLVLFTAKEHMNKTFSLIKKQYRGNIEVIKQSPGSSQKGTIEKFIKTKGVLLSTSLWEGFNVVGPDLSCVVIARLPFPVVDDPVIKNKSKKIKNPFQEIILPLMLLKLRQGVGRLIRSENDCGIIAILDSRLSEEASKSYRSIVLDSLPFKNHTESFQDVIAFFSRLEKTA